MKKRFFSLLTVLAGMSFPMLAANAEAQQQEDWRDARIFERNRLGMHSTFESGRPTLSLNGLWKFQFFDTPEGRDRNFYRPGSDDSKWGTMPVPGVWELNGYGDPVYLNIGYAWRGFAENTPPFVPYGRNHVGQYRKNFTLDKSWRGREIILHIGAACSNVRVWVNGKFVGYSQDSKLEACFDISRFVAFDRENLVALEIFRWCDGTYLEDQDFWRLSGISRDVFIEARNGRHIEDIQIEADADGNFRWKVYASKGVKSVKINLEEKNFCWTGSKPAVQSDGSLLFSSAAKFDNVRQWTAETPDLYTVNVECADAKGTIDRASLKIGFRTVEMSDSLLKINGKRVLIKGVNRHEMNPYTGYVVSKEDMERDIRIMKSLNFNAVRTCHYPDDPYWYSLCDKYGLYVIDEANVESHGMGYGKTSLASDPQYADAVMARFSRMVRRDRNHPSVIIWSLGNESGNGDNFRATYKWGKENDRTRPVQYERAVLEENTDIYCPMYADYAKIEKYALSNPWRPCILCEYAHAMGNSMGGFKEYWDLFRKYPSLQGGFIWDFADQALYKKVNAEEYGTGHIYAFGGDYNNFDPADSSFNCNGVIAADRTLHPHAHEVAYQLRPIHSSASPQQIREGIINVYNEYLFKSLDDFRMEWEIVVNGEKFLTGAVERLDVGPGETAPVSLGLGGNLLPPSEGNDIYLNLYYSLKRPCGILPAGTVLATDQLAVSEDMSVKVAAGDSCPDIVREDGYVVLTGLTDGRAPLPWTIIFNEKTGVLSKYSIGGRVVVDGGPLPCFGRATTDNDFGESFHGGSDTRFFDHKAVWDNPSFELEKLDVGKDGAAAVLTATYKPIGDYAYVTMDWRISSNGLASCTMRLHDAGRLKAAPFLMRFGIEMSMPGEFAFVDFYGKGPYETYVDRQSSAFVGHYRQSVSEQYHYGYVHPQESGCHVGLKYFDIIDGNGSGLKITSPSPFNASALPFCRSDLDRLQNAPRHSLELLGKAHNDDVDSRHTSVILDSVHSGLGCVTSFGTFPREEYIPFAAEYSFEFNLSPVGQ